MTTKDQVAQLIVGEAQARNHTRDECLGEMSALYQESGWDETVWDSTHTTYGVAQQDGSYPNRFDGAAAQIKAFFDKLDVKRTSPGHGDIWLNICWLQQAPNWPSAQYWYDHGRRAYLDEIKSRIATVTPYLDKYWPASGGTPVTDNRPDFNEFPVWSNNSQDRGGTKITTFCIHTQEGGGGNSAAEDLAHYLQGDVSASYHYTVSQASDGGVTVCDVVDTDQASWSVGNANNFTINLCFAGSSASWSRAQWLQQAKAIDVAAYLAVQDSKKYGFSTLVVPPPYSAGKPGISDHKWVTQVYGWGTHTDVGDGFPWDVFAAAVSKYAAGNGGDTPVTPPSPQVKRFPDDWTDRELMVEILRQLRGPTLEGWNQLGGRSLVDALGAVGEKFGIEGCDDRGVK